MALLAEEIVEEWLNRQGYFTIRGIKIGVQELDLLAIRVLDKGELECRHIEVQASIKPVSYISRVPKEIQKKFGRSSTSQKRREHEELASGVKEWVAKKYEHKEKLKLMRRLVNKEWTRELIVHNVAHPEELEFIAKHNIKIIKLVDIITDIKTQKSVIEKAAGADLLDLVNF